MKAVIFGILILGSLSVSAEDIHVRVKGMVCSLCAQGIQKKFSGEVAVKHIEVNLDQKLVRIQTKDGATVSDETITKFITEAGYNVAAIERK